MNKTTEPCPCQNQSGREFVAQMNYMENVAPVRAFGEEQRKTITHAGKIVEKTAWSIVLSASIGALVVGGINYFFDRKNNKENKEPKKEVVKD